MATPPQPPSEGGRTYTLTDASEEHPSPPPPPHQLHNNHQNQTNLRRTTPPPPPQTTTTNTPPQPNELRPLKKPNLQEDREVDKGVSDEERRSSGTYKKGVLPPPTSSALTNNSKSLVASASTNGCPVHDPTHPHYRPPHTYPPSSSSGGSSRSSAADSQLLHCGICTQRYSNPKVLPCLHTFCERCLISYTPPESLTLTCPVCRQQSILPKDGVPGLQSNTWVRGVMEAMDGGASGPHPNAPGPCALCNNSQSTARCRQCHTHLCATCATRHTQDSGSESHSVVSLSDSEAGLPHSNGYHDDDTTLYCPSHQGQTLRFYCRDCETAVCSSCTDIEHRAHNTLHLTDAVEEHRTAMHQLIDRVTMQLPCVKEVICDIQDVCRNLRERRTEAEKDIRRCFDSLHELLDKRQTTLINSLNTIESEKQQTLDNQKEELETWVGGVESGCEFVEKALTHCPAMEVVLVRKQLGERLMDYANMNVPPAPRENSHLKFVVGNIDPLKTAFLHVGSIQSNSAVPHQTSATGESLRQVSVGRQSIVTVVTRDHKGEKASCGGAEVTAAISRTSLTVVRHGSNSPRATSLSPRATSKSPSGSREELCQPQVLDLNNGTYEVAFTVHGEGTYSLEVLLYGHPINGSPFSIAATPPLEEDSGSSQRSVPPHTLARQTSHSTQVTSRASRASRRPLSHRSSCSRRTNPIEDDMLLRVGRRGRNRGEFVNPQGIAYNTIKDGRIAVADSNNQCIQVFTLAGECKLRFGVRGRSIGQMQRPTGVAALPNGNYVVADYENKWVSIFEPSGKFITRIGHGKLLGPKGVCVDNNGHIIVVDNKASCICVFQQSGKLLTKFGNRGTDEFQFAGPHFAAVNSMGQIVITDFHNHCVKVFDSDGDFLFTFGTSGEGNGQFNAPTGIAVDSNDNIIVADWGNSRIQVFDAQGSFLSYVNTLADPLYGPQGMTLTPDGQIFVADSGNHCFKVYKYLQ